MFQRSSTYIMSVENGWKVLFDGLYDESAPPADIADRLSASFPHWSLIPLTKMQVAHVAQLDKWATPFICFLFGIDKSRRDLLDGLHKVGFRTNLGYMDTGFALLAWGRAGGYYLGMHSFGFSWMLEPMPAFQILERQASSLKARSSSRMTVKSKSLPSEG
jgi:hypothetical protein